MSNNSIIFPNLGITLENVGKNISIGGFTIAFYGIIIAIGMLVGVSYILREAKRLGYSEDQFLDICIITIVLSVIGARAYYCIFAWDYYKDNPISVLNIRQGGLAIYGGILTGVVTVTIICRIKKYELLEVLDIVIFGVIIGQIFGRWGNFFNREAFGQYSDGMFAMQLPMGAVRSTSDFTQQMLDNVVTIDGIDFVSVHPTFLYESMWNLGVLIIMLLTHKRKKFKGQIFATYAIGYGVGRFWIEGLRTDQLKLWHSGIPVSQVVAVGMIVAGLLIVVLGLRKKPEQTA